jgi:hypothetical protein
MDPNEETPAPELTDSQRLMVEEITRRMEAIVQKDSHWLKKFLRDMAKTAAGVLDRIM